MTKTFQEPILNQPISELEMSTVFKKLTLQYHFKTLGDILKMPTPNHLLLHQGFDLRHLMEFTAILTKNNLGHYLMPV